jgi:hypothetical protein
LNLIRDEIKRAESEVEKEKQTVVKKEINETWKRIKENIIAA